MQSTIFQGMFAGITNRILRGYAHRNTRAATALGMPWFHSNLSLLLVFVMQRGDDFRSCYLDLSANGVGQGQFFVKKDALADLPSYQPAVSVIGFQCPGQCKDNGQSRLSIPVPNATVAQITCTSLPRNISCTDSRTWVKARIVSDRPESPFFRSPPATSSCHFCFTIKDRIVTGAVQEMLRKIVRFFFSITRY